MRTIVSVNAKGGCGKSTIAMNVAASLGRCGFKVLLVDTDPQSQLTQWTKNGDGFHDAGTLTAALAGKEPFENVISMTDVPNVWFVPSSEGLEALSREMTDTDGYYTVFTTMLATQADRFDFTVIDAPNQISPLMESAIWPADLFVVPFESTKAVRSYANFYQLVLKLRPNDLPPMLHVLSNLSKQMGLRKRVIETMQLHGITPAATEVRTCGWLAQVDEHGGDIFAWRPHSIGAIDITRLTDEILTLFGHITPESPPTSGALTPTSPPEIDAAEPSMLGTFKLREDQLIPEHEYQPSNTLPPRREDTQDLINNFTI
jgi:chromosome partitioning protein